MKILLANRIAPDGTPHTAASHLGLFCLHMYHKKDARLFNATYTRENEYTVHLQSISKVILGDARHFVENVFCRKCCNFKNIHRKSWRFIP